METEDKSDKENTYLNHFNQAAKLLTLWRLRHEEMPYFNLPGNLNFWTFQTCVNTRTLIYCQIIFCLLKVSHITRPPGADPPAHLASIIQTPWHLPNKPPGPILELRMLHRFFSTMWLYSASSFMSSLEHFWVFALPSCFSSLQTIRSLNKDIKIRLCED